MIWVIDASVAVKWFILEETHPAADGVLTALIARPQSFAVPELFAFEVFSFCIGFIPNPDSYLKKASCPCCREDCCGCP